MSGAAMANMRPSTGARPLAKTLIDVERLMRGNSSRRLLMKRLISAALLAATSVVGSWTSAMAAPIAIANHSFQLPARAGDGNVSDEDAYDVANPVNLPPTNWTFVNTANMNYGQARPDPDSQFFRDITGGETSPFTAGGFDGDLILFGNMNAPAASHTATSDVVGQLAAGTYTLTVALGARNTGSWNDINYTIGLVGPAALALSIPTAVTLNPGQAAQNTASSPWTTDTYNVVDVTNTLVVPAGSPLIGQNYSVQVFAQNSGLHDGLPDTDFAQAAIDNVRLDFVAIPEPGTAVLSGLAVLATFFSRRRRHA
jgi:hypothetical protein